MNDWLNDAVQRAGFLLFADHPTSRHLVLYADAPDELTADQRRTVADHLELCDDCADDLARLRTVADDLDRTPGAQPSPTLRQRLARLLHPTVLIPAVSLAVAAYAVFGPRQTGPLVQPVTRAATLRAETERGEATPVATDAAGRLVLSFVLPDDGDAPVERCDVTILRADGSVAARIADIDAFDAFGTFLLVVDAGKLSPGPYLLEARDRLGVRRFPLEITDPEHSRE